MGNLVVQNKRKEIINKGKKSNKTLHLLDIEDKKKEKKT